MCKNQQKCKTQEEESVFYFWEIAILLITSHNLQGKGKYSRDHEHIVSLCKGMGNGKDTGFDGQELTRRQDPVCRG